MPVSATYLANCRTAINASAELAAMRTAGTLTTHTRAATDAQWAALHNKDSQGTSPVFRARQAVRDIVNAEADKTGNVAPEERESTYRTLVDEFVPRINQPRSIVEETIELRQILREDMKL